MPGRSIRYSALLYLGATTFYAASQWATGFVLAYTSGPYFLGLFAAAAIVGTPLVSLTQLSLRQVIVADVGVRFTFQDYLRLRVASVVVALVASAMLIRALGYTADAYIIVTLFIAARCVDGVGDIYYGHMQRSDQPLTLAIHLIARSAWNAGWTLSVLIVTKSVLAAAAAATLSTIAFHVAFSLLWPTAPSFTQRRRRDRWKGRYALSLAVRAAPLTLSGFIGAFAAYAPRLVVERLGGPATLGQLAIIDYFIAALALIVAALGQAVSPKLALAYHARDERSFQRLVVKTVSLTLAIVAVSLVATILVGGRIINWLYGDTFELARECLPVVMIGASFQLVASLLGYVPPTTGIYKGLVWRQIITLAVAALATLAGYRFFGLAGIGLGLGLSGFVSAALYVDLIRSRLAILPRSSSPNPSEMCD